MKPLFLPRAQSHIYPPPNRTRSKSESIFFNKSPKDFFSTPFGTSSPCCPLLISLLFHPLKNIGFNFFCYQQKFRIFELAKNTLFTIIGTKKIMLCSQFVYFNKMKTSYSQHVCYQHYAPLRFFKHNLKDEDDFCWICFFQAKNKNKNS